MNKFKYINNSRISSFMKNIGAIEIRRWQFYFEIFWWQRIYFDLTASADDEKSIIYNIITQTYKIWLQDWEYWIKENIKEVLN